MSRKPSSLFSIVASPRLALFVAATSLVAAPLTLLLAQEVKKQSAAKPPHPVVDAHELMELFAEPLHEYLKKEIDQTGERDSKAWGTLGDRGLQTAEVANLIALREQKENRQQWIDDCATLQEAGLKLHAVAKAKNAAQVRPAYLGIIQACNACHQQFEPDHAPEIEP